MRMSEKKAYYRLEKHLKSRYKHIRDNELYLTSEDFESNKLENSAFIRLSEECWYIPYGERVIIKSPNITDVDLKTDMGFYAVRALIKIKKERQDTLLVSISLFLFGISVLAFLSFFWGIMYYHFFWAELFTIISWAFVWSGVTNWFIDKRHLKDQRFTILQLLSAEIIAYEETPK